MRLTKLSCLLLAGMETCIVPQLSSPTPTRHSNYSEYNHHLIETEGTLELGSLHPPLC